MKHILLSISAIAALSISVSSIALSDATDSNSLSPLSLQIKKLDAKTKKLEAEVKKLNASSKVTKITKKTVVHTTPSITPWPHFVTVTTTSFLGKKMAYDGADVLYNVSSINEDLHLLQNKQGIENLMASEGYAINRPILQISGDATGELYSTGGYNTAATDGLSLSTAEIDMNAIASPWATGFMSLDYNGSPVSSGNREPNSKIYLSRGFVTIGNLNVTPIYFSAGLMYAPFGVYSNDMVTEPLTQSMGKIRTPAALLGFNLNDGLFGSIYGFSGNQTSGPSELFKQEGANLGFGHTYLDKNTFAVGAGWVSNIADSMGMQNTGLSSTTQFNGFGVFSSPLGGVDILQPSSNNNLVHQVNAMDGNATATFGNITLIGEYLGAVERFASADMTYNNQGAEPSAMHAEIDYLLPFFAKKYGTTLGASYGHSWQALALNLPNESYATFLNTSIWRETQESIEYRHDSDYSASTTANGRGGLPTSPIVGTGRSRNTVTGQLSVFF